MRTLRLRFVWALVLPFLWFASPSGRSLLTGASFALVGLAVRAWAAGSIRKESVLTTTGPYAYTRNPLYLGTLLLGLGISLGGGHAIWPALFLAFYLAVYVRTMIGEAELLAEIFGERYRRYASRVPAFVPRLTPYGDTDGVTPYGDADRLTPHGDADHLTSHGDADHLTSHGDADPAPGGGFLLARYGRNREWEALLGTVLVFTYLAARLWLA